MEDIGETDADEVAAVGSVVTGARTDTGLWVETTWKVSDVASAEEFEELKEEI